MDSPDIRGVVKERYAQAALRVTAGGSYCCAANSVISRGCGAFARVVVGGEHHLGQ